MGTPDATEGQMRGAKKSVATAMVLLQTPPPPRATWWQQLSKPKAACQASGMCGKPAWRTDTCRLGPEPTTQVHDVGTSHEGRNTWNVPVRRRKGRRGRREGSIFGANRFWFFSRRSVQSRSGPCTLVAAKVRSTLPEAATPQCDPTLAEVLVHRGQRSMAPGGLASPLLRESPTVISLPCLAARAVLSDEAYG